MDKMKLKFPHYEECEFEYGKPVVILGANGSGKTRFSVKLEEVNDPAYNNGQLAQSHIHRLSAQKSLSIPTTISITDYESAERNLFIGKGELFPSKINTRFQHNPATVMLNDYEYALSYLFAKSQNELEEEHCERKTNYQNGLPERKPTDTVVDKAERIWNTLLPHRTIDLSKNGVHACFDGKKYHGKEMSDGERVMLYMIAQALIVKPNSLLIIDEPELHIHKSIVKELWTTLENERPDCIFMYITHDIDFAMSRNSARYLWIKSFSGSEWDYEFINADQYSDLPSELLFEVLGSRQKILFVEGTKNSYDYKLYQELYRDKGYHVIPCGGCQEVIRLVKAKNAYEGLQMISVNGIIDRDYRTEKEIESLQEDGIYALKVAEVENLFVVPELLDFMETQLGCETGKAKDAKDFIIGLFNKLRQNQVAEALSKELTHQLSLFDIGKEAYSAADIKAIIDNKYSVESIELWKREKEQRFNVSDELPEILKVFNYKELSKKIGSKFGLADREWPERILNLITKDSSARSAIISAISNYLPEIPE